MFIKFGKRLTNSTNFTIKFAYGGHSLLLFLFLVSNNLNQRSHSKRRTLFQLAKCPPRAYYYFTWENSWKFEEISESKKKNEVRRKTKVTFWDLRSELLSHATPESFCTAVPRAVLPARVDRTGGHRWRSPVVKIHVCETATCTEGGKLSVE